MTSENIWNLLGKIDTFYGVIGGVGMTWTFIAWLRMRLIGADDVDRTREPLSRFQTIENKLVESVVTAKGAILIALGIFLVIALRLLFQETSGQVEYWLLFYFFITCGAIFLGLVVGTFYDIILSGNGKAISFAVFGAVILAILAALTETESGIGRPVALISMIGALVFGWFGLYAEPEVGNEVTISEISWNTADEKAKIAFQNKLNDRYDWYNYRIRVDDYTYSRGKGQMIVTIEKRKGYSAYWIPVEYYVVEFIQTGEILSYKNVTDYNEE